MKKKIAAFDIDGTIFRNSLLIELHWKLVRRGIIFREDIKKLDHFYWRWVNREGEYSAYIDEVIENFKTHIKEVPEKVVNSAVKKVVDVQSNIIYRYTRDLVKELKKDHIMIAISGSPMAIVEEFARVWEFDYIVGTEYEIINGIYTGNLLNSPVDDKKKVLQELCSDNNLSLEGSTAIGDTESDIGMLELVENPICFNPTQLLFERAKERKWQVVVERKNVIYKL